MLNHKNYFDGITFLLFDLGNTLLPSIKFMMNTWEITLFKYGYDFNKFHDIYWFKLFVDEGAFCNEKKLNYIFNQLNWEKKYLHDILENYQNSYRKVLDNELKLDPNNTWTFLKNLKSNYSMGILSDNSIATKNEWDILLENHNMSDVFKFFITSEEIGHRKPHKAMFKAAIKQSNRKSNEIVYFGDNLRRDNLALKYGMKFCYVYGYTKQQRKSEYNSILFINKENLKLYLVID